MSGSAGEFANLAFENGSGQDGGVCRVKRRTPIPLSVLSRTPFIVSMDISGKTAIVTGAGSGIGRAVAEVLAEAGANGIVIADVDAAGAEKTRRLVEDNSQTKCSVVETDVADELQEFALEGILANAIAPGTIDTPITDSFGDHEKRKFAEASTLKRQGTPRELADAVLFLVSERSTYINGATLHVNAGSLLI